MCNLRGCISLYRQLIWLTLLAVLISSSSAPGAQTLLVSTGAVWRYFDGGMEPGPEWQNPLFDDSLWRTGPGEFGFGDGDEATVLTPVNAAYFRTTFTVANPADLLSLFADVWQDDGVIVYINGVEVLRNNLPPGAVDYFTVATAPDPDDGDFPVRANLTPAVLVGGLNTIAAEVHRSSRITDPDLSFDLMLMADTVDPNRPPVANNQSVLVDHNTPTSIALSGSDPDGNPITFIITGSPAHGTLSGSPPLVVYTPAQNYAGPDSFTFKVNDGALDSADATVSIQVVAPPDPPEIVSAVGACDGMTVTVAFNEAVEQVSATDVSHYRIVDLFGNSTVPVSASLAADQGTVTLTLSSPLNPALVYTLRASSICDLVGDCLQQQSVPIAFDGQPPTLVCDATSDTLWPPNHGLLDVGLIANGSERNLQVQVFSDEPDSGEGDAVLANGRLYLRSQREGKSDGRVYLIVLTSIGSCRNVAVCCTTVVGPHDSSQGALDAVNAQAAAAQAQCSPNGSSITPYRLLP